jgi:hypothetical protein
MGLFDVNPNWYNKYWYSPEPLEASWRAHTAVISMVVIMIVAMLT